MTEKALSLSSDLIKVKIAILNPPFFFSFSEISKRRATCSP